jgi:hypothetical protein
MDGYYYSPPFPCLTDGGRAGTGGRGRDFVYADSSKSARRKVKPTIEAFPIGPKMPEPFRSPLTGVDLIVRM